MAMTFCLFNLKIFITRLKPTALVWSFLISTSYASPFQLVARTLFVFTIFSIALILFLQWMVMINSFGSNPFTLLFLFAIFFNFENMTRKYSKLFTCWQIFPLYQ